MTERASKFLKKLEWKSVVKNRTQLIDTFTKNHIDIFDPILDFQIEYGGLVTKIGLEPVCWGVQHLNPRGEFENYEIIEFIHEGEYPEFSLLCADTLWQVRWTIDAKGAIFEDFDILTNSFDKIIEDYALWDELACEGDVEFFKRNIYGKDIEVIIKDFVDVYPFEELQEPGIKWFKCFNSCYLIESNKEVMILGPTNFTSGQRREIIELVG